MLRVTVAQLNYMVGDLAGNVAKMIAAARDAAAAHAELVVFSELSLTGYYPGDPLDEPDFLARVAQGLCQLQAASARILALHWIVGAPLAREGSGKRLHNALVVLKAGEIVLRYAKQLLPTYNIFDELRHFAPGPDVARVLRIGSTQVGLMICEDGWNDDGADYAVNPFSRLADAAPDLYGDTNGGPGLIGDLYKTEVFALSRHVNEAAGRELIPQAIIDKEPFAELAPDQRDTDSLPPYPVLDEILKLLIEGARLAPAELAHANEFVAALRTRPEGEAPVTRVRGMIARNEYKRRQAPPIIRVRSRAFGSGRQMPIAAKIA